MAFMPPSEQPYAEIGQSLSWFDGWGTWNLKQVWYVSQNHEGDK